MQDIGKSSIKEIAAVRSMGADPQSIQEMLLPWSGQANE